jgi:hypothetical protein
VVALVGVQLAGTSLPAVDKDAVAAFASIHSMSDCLCCSVDRWQY